jgi:hypothetical protein
MGFFIEKFPIIFRDFLSQIFPLFFPKSHPQFPIQTQPKLIPPKKSKKARKSTCPSKKIYYFRK